MNPTRVMPAFAQAPTASYMVCCRSGCTESINPGAGLTSIITPYGMVLCSLFRLASLMALAPMAMKPSNLEPRRIMSSRSWNTVSSMRCWAALRSSAARRSVK